MAPDKRPSFRGMKSGVGGDECAVRGCLRLARSAPALVFSRLRYASDADASLRPLWPAAAAAAAGGTAAAAAAAPAGPAAAAGSWLRRRRCLPATRVTPTAYGCDEMTLYVTGREAPSKQACEYEACASDDSAWRVHGGIRPARSLLVCEMRDLVPSQRMLGAGARTPAGSNAAACLPRGASTWMEP
jgi:hypothetical protein